MELVLIPLPEDSGIWFQRVDNPGARPICASTENVSDTSLATSIGAGDEKVGTLEHLLAALGGLGISNLKVEVNGPEVPILDGSAAPWATMLQKAGVKTLNAPRPFYLVKKAFALEDATGEKFISVSPASSFSLECSIEFPGYVKNQSKYFSFSKSAFVRDICPARTFCLEKDVEMMRQNNLALGGSLDNAVVIGTNGEILNPEGLRFPDECVRHKILDFLGDLTLAQYPIIGHFSAYKTGHALNQEFLKNILKKPGILEKVMPELEFTGFELPITGVALAS
jgi:UDP-3-O-[3-hydroxymyristoyl] N-acetylglucosamine deacetylase